MLLIFSTTPSLISPFVSSTGEISVSTGLDYETGDSYTILIKVKSLFLKMLLYVHVNDEKLIRL